MARRAPRRAVLAVGVTSSLPSAAPGARSGRPTGRVSFNVFTQVVTSHKSLVANRTREPFLPGVCAQMSLELIGAREPLATKEPIAHKRSLTCVPSQVSFKMRRFPINFTTSWNVTAMETLPPEAGPRRAQPLCLLTVRAVARRSSRVAPSRGPRGSR